MTHGEFRQSLPDTPIERVKKKLNREIWDGCDDIKETVKEGIYCIGCKYEKICKEAVYGR